MPHVNKHLLGPGQYESLMLKTWVSKVEGYARQRLTGRVHGTYTVYCGEGNEHDFEVNETISHWNHEIQAVEGFETDATLLFEIHNFINKVDATYELVGRIVNYALEDWSDPCEVAEL